MSCHLSCHLPCHLVHALSRIRSSLLFAAVATALTMLATCAFGDVVIGPLSGTSASGNPVGVSANLVLSGTVLTITLDNTSRVDTKKSADVLSSMYFDITSVSGTNVFRPTLSYLSATGTVYQVFKSGTDTLLGTYDLKATKNGDNTWQYRTMDPAASPFLGFGIGTVGNNNYSPNNGFTPAIVDQINFGIYRASGPSPDITPTDGNLDGRQLVWNRATFQFGVSGTTADGKSFTEANITPEFTFGFGTSPDSTLALMPEPDGFVLVCSCLATLGLCACRRQWFVGQAKRRSRLPSGSRTTSSRNPSA